MYAIAFCPNDPPTATYVVPGPRSGRPELGSIEPAAPCEIVESVIDEHPPLIAPCTMPPASSSSARPSAMTSPDAFLHTFITMASKHEVPEQNCCTEHAVPHAP